MAITVNGVAINEAEINEAVEQANDAPGARDAITQELILREVLTQQARKEGITNPDADAAIGELLDSHIKVEAPSEEECRRFYDENPQSFMRGEQVEAAHILFAVEDATSAGLVRARAEGVLAEVKAEPYKFAAVAREQSACPSGKQGGELGRFGRGQMVPEFEAAAFSLKEGEISPELVETQFGFHIIKAGAKHGGEKVSFDEARERLTGFLAEMANRRALSGYLNQLVSEAKVEGYTLPTA
ncbi:peptidyl-prolyl cis-trans isomerase [Chitiniphilus shinanonensis]|uniref:peptidylprolyl isomerase n=1 Tax=Chitiniphilus shinanonensis TaxID=553088 RepID=A0ABQ6BRV8_9NEIS|nr:peptidylprolyl isomerase [Chitiniphilus shinanonensis]GLS04182.1 peptidyl-prolyl cis-trans isomerase [Chitiniphilus shinanonensis]